MYLESTRAQRVVIRGLGLEEEFAAGEMVHTENSYKYSLREIDDLARAAGLTTVRRWLDAEERFSLNLFAAG
jgi:L-histidine N-alpha-methyltransferase